MTLTNVFDKYDSYYENNNYYPQSIEKIPFSELTASEINTCDIVKSKEISSIPKWRFRSGNEIVLSTKPIEIIIETGKEQIFTYNENLAIYASGHNLFESLDDFGEQLVYFYNYYKNLSYDQVTGQAIELKKIFENIF